MKAMRCWWWLALAVSAFLGTAAAKVICATADGFEVCVGGCASKGGCDPNGCTWNSCNQIPCLKTNGDVEYCLKGLGCAPRQSGCAKADDHPAKCTEPNFCNEVLKVSRCGDEDCKVGFRACCTKSGCANPDQCKKADWKCTGGKCDDWRPTCMDASLKRVECDPPKGGLHFCNLQGGCAQSGCLEGKDCCKGIECNAAKCLDEKATPVLCPVWLGGCAKKMFGGCDYITCLGTDLKEVNCPKSQGGCAASGGCGEGGCTDADLCNQIRCNATDGLTGSICLKGIGCADGGSGCAWPASTTTTTTATTTSTATTTTNTTTTTSTNTTTDAKSTADPTSTPSTTTTALFTICLFSLLLHHRFN